MSEHLCVPASNKYSLQQSNPIWANRESAESNQGERKKYMQAELKYHFGPEQERRTKSRMETVSLQCSN